MDKSSLVYPMFVMDGENKKEEIPTMPGQFRYTLDRMPEALNDWQMQELAVLCCSESRSTRMKWEAVPSLRRYHSESSGEGKEGSSGSVLHR